ncbi:hypothetical protein LNAOJCKE_0418 [Methylorubrum aminovorans]|uniref:Scaffolding protein n=1 Tax=Methylorubrum aminovorans TaxID=269069 RepID=A0ABQ4U700_9HYPH|nr:hypothetical protein [Methylorubrum aminovorans]GJE63224.1 hypothetical protein LNAOJCKE_0418 [Methylorubrum aminovorans]GMA79267.1 hypothetical protein GCM10025880_56840 [Methylorubrum aminovorans]
MTIEVGATHSGAPQDDSPEAVADFFLSRQTNADTGHSDPDDEEDLETDSDEFDDEDEDAEDGHPDSDSEDDEEETEETDDADSSEGPEQNKRVDDDEAVVTVRFNDEDHQVTVKDLKRLYGQERALNRKSEEASETKRQADEAYTYASTALTKLYQQAEQAYRAKYEGVNFNVQAAEEGWTGEDWRAVTAMEAEDRKNLEFLRNDLTNLVQQHEQQKQQAEHAQKIKYAQETRQALFDPVHGIKDFTDDRLNTLGLFAINDLGFDTSFVNSLATTRNDAALVKALNELYEFKRAAKVGANALATKTTKPAKPVKGRPVRSPTEAARKPIVSDRTKSAKSRLARTGSVDDAVALVMSRMRDD